MRLCHEADVDLDDEGAKQIATAILAGGANWMVSAIALDLLTMAIPGVNVAVNGAVNAFYTYRYLRTVAALVSGAEGPGSVILENGISLIVSSLSALAPHVIARDIWEMKQLLA